jgi:putative intracellular protease/amidase
MVKISMKSLFILINFFWALVYSQMLLGETISKGKILIIVSSENTLVLKNGKKFPTGHYLNELTVPAKALADAHYTLVFATPKGDPSYLDKSSDDAKYFGGDELAYREMKKFYDSLTSLKKPLSFKAVLESDLSQYSAIFVPGGHAPMIDLVKDAKLGELFQYFHKEKKATALICHGTVALLSSAFDPIWVYKNYRMTVFSTAEEKLAEKKLGGIPQFYPEEALLNAGGKMTIAAPWKSNVVIDRELITGQNPNSDKELANALLSALTKK